MKTLPKILLIINLLLLDAAGGYLVYKNLIAQKEGTTTDVASPLEISSGKTEGTCSEGCLDYINQKIPGPVTVIPTVTAAPQVTTIVSKEKVKSVSYVPIPGAGSTLETDWTALSGTDFYLSKADFPGLTEVYFEANVRLVNGNGKAYVRLYDTTHGIAVNGSELLTSSQTSTFLSTQKIFLWDGFNHYQIQAKSLTADTTEYTSGRLKIITEN